MEEIANNFIAAI